MIYRITHRTVQTGDIWTGDKEIDSQVLRKMQEMESEPVLGYRLVVESHDPLLFVVCREQGAALTAMTRNRATGAGRDVNIDTDIPFPMEAGEASMMADLEQCAAIMLLAKPTHAP